MPPTIAPLMQPLALAATGMLAIANARHARIDFIASNLRRLVCQSASAGFVPRQQIIPRHSAGGSGQPKSVVAMSSAQAALERVSEVGPLPGEAAVLFRRT